MIEMLSQKNAKVVISKEGIAVGCLTLQKQMNSSPSLASINLMSTSSLPYPPSNCAAIVIQEMTASATTDALHFARNGLLKCSNLVNQISTYTVYLTWPSTWILYLKYAIRPDIRSFFRFFRNVSRLALKDTSHRLRKHQSFLRHTTWSLTS